jgi:hypothetical protein
MNRLILQSFLKLIKLKFMMQLKLPCIGDNVLGFSLKEDHMIVHNYYR